MVKLSGRLLVLTDDPSMIARQLSGEGTVDARELLRYPFVTGRSPRGP